MSAFPFLVRRGILETHHESRKSVRAGTVKQGKNFCTIIER